MSQGAQKRWLRSGEKMEIKMKQNMDRRTFLRTAGLGGASLAVSAGLADKLPAAEASDKSSLKSMPRRILGRTGVSVSILGMGGSIDPSGYQLLLRMGLKMGVNYWDSSYNYGNGKNEQVIGQFFGKYPEERKNVFQVTKASGTTEPAGMTKQLNISLERMQTDYIDLYLMHMLQDPGLLTTEIKEWAEQKKKEGKIRFFGFSCHANMALMLLRASTLGWIDALMTSYNYQLMNDDGIERGIDACARANIGLIAMKIQGERFRTSDSPEDLAAINHFINKGYTLQQARHKAVWEDERITTCLSEITNLTILKDNVAAATDGVKLSDKDREVLDKHAQNNRKFYCRGCLSCESVMGVESGIPDVLRYMMYYTSYAKRDNARRLFMELPESVRNSLALRDYSPAERVCPNRIEIGKAMREAARILGNGSIV
jgi:predicted aldo/keto reductase-like oxidoreductase